MKEEYKPNCTSRLANLAYAMPCGTTKAPTVTPAYRVSGVDISSAAEAYQPRDLRGTI